MPIFLLLQLSIQILILGCRGMIWACRYAFYLCGGLLIACTLPQVEYAALGFAIGVGCAAAAHLFLSNYALFYRQVVFGGVGFLTGVVVAVQAQGDASTLGILALTLAGLCLWQAHRGS